MLGSWRSRRHFYIGWLQEAATPHATGCAVLLIDSGEALTPAAIEARLEKSPFIVTDPKSRITRPRIDCSYSAIAALSALITRVNAMGVPGGSASSYAAPLNQGLASLKSGNVTLVQKMLTSFAKHVRSDRRSAYASAGG